MGIPSFFKWLQRKYPKTCVDAKEAQEVDVRGNFIAVDARTPNPNGLEFDNLYFDLNGIIHPCAHPERGPQPKNEAEMMVAIVKSIDRLFNIVRPRKVVFIAIDGVAPRAKMNQQRSRRFRAVQERQEIAALESELISEYKQRTQSAAASSSAEDIDSVLSVIDASRRKTHAETAWDSNVITPGTPFMETVAEILRLHASRKLAEDPAWQNIKVIISDSNVPGEGEHKVMEFVRQQRLNSGYDPNTRHCLVGLDADLIMLSLATHEPHFSILREFTGTEELGSKLCGMCGQPGHDRADCTGKPRQKSGAFDELELQSARTPYFFVHIQILREYFENEFRVLAREGALPFGFNLERIIDDFVFLCFFCGNDFLPKLPSMDIRQGAVETLMESYKQQLPNMPGYLTDNGRVFPDRVQWVMDELASQEEEKLRKKGQKNQNSMRRARAEISASLNGNGGGGGHRRGRDEFERGVAQGTSHFVKAGAPEAESEKKDIREVSELPSAKAAQSEQEEDKAVRKRRRVTEEGADEPTAFEEKESVPEAGFADEDDDEEDEVVDASPSVSVTELKKAKEQMKFLVEERQKQHFAPKMISEMRWGEDGWRERYYQLKFKFVDLESSVKEREAICQSYIEGLCWVLQYYYHGCCSWNWYYPYHYAPFASDMTDIRRFKIRFTKGQPFKPFEQLMSVLPAGSAHALPTPFHDLMTNPKSPIIDFYPHDFDLDLEGCSEAWQGVILLPFIDEKRLLETVRPIEDSLSEEEKKRNRVGKDALLVGGRHPLCAQIKFLYKKPDFKAAELIPEAELQDIGYSESNKKLPKNSIKIDSTISMGLNGFLSPSDGYRPFGAKYESPVPEQYIPSIESNGAICAAFTPPPFKRHVNGLLPGFIPDPRVVSIQFGIDQSYQQQYGGRGGYQGGRGGYQGGGRGGYQGGGRGGHASLERAAFDGPQQRFAHQPPIHIQGQGSAAIPPPAFYQDRGGSRGGRGGRGGWAGGVPPPPSAPQQYPARPFQEQYFPVNGSTKR